MSARTENDHKLQKALAYIDPVARGERARAATRAEGQSTGDRGRGRGGGGMTEPYLRVTLRKKLKMID